MGTPVLRIGILRLVQRADWGTPLPNILFDRV